MLVAVKRDFRQYATMHGSRSAAEVAEFELGDPGNQAVKCPSAEYLERSAGTGPAASGRKVSGIQGSEQLTDVCTVNLMVGGQGDYQFSGCLPKPRHERGGFAERAGEHDNLQRLAVANQLLQSGGEAFARTVYNEYDLVAHGGGRPASGI